MTIVMAQQGWQCPNCGNIISPNMMWCPFCSGEKKVTYTTTSTPYKVDTSSVCKTENSSEKPNNCEDEPQTYKINPKEPTNMPKCFDCEDFFTCDGQCDEIECEKCKHFREEADTYTKQCEFYFMECKYEPKDEPQICDTCRYYNGNIPCGSTPSACKEADKFAEEFVDGLKKLKPKDEPQTDDAYFLELMGAVERGEISDAGANQAWYEYINHKTEPQTERSE